MQKIITIVLLALFFTLDVSGSETRVFSMGRVGYFIRDNSNITTFPGTLMRYGNEVVTELRWKDTESSYSAEARLPVNTNFMVGINFNRPIGMFVPNMSTFVELDETSDLYLGTRFIGHDVALRLSLGRDAFSQDSSAGNPRIGESARYLELAGGISSDMYDLAGSLELPSIKGEQGITSDEWSGVGINLHGRFHYQVNEKVRVVPVGHLGFSSSSRTFNPGTAQPKQETDYGTFGFNLGVGINYKVN